MIASLLQYINKVLKEIIAKKAFFPKIFGANRFLVTSEEEKLASSPVGWP